MEVWWSQGTRMTSRDTPRRGGETTTQRTPTATTGAFLHDGTREARAGVECRRSSKQCAGCWLLGTVSCVLHGADVARDGVRNPFVLGENMVISNGFSHNQKLSK
eukprot:1219209-Rhodomonas_salina.1